jgi:hypothetical protein
VRYRAKPSFTVEVKRNNKRLPLTVTAPGSSPGERYRQADQVLFGDLSCLAEPAERFKDSRLSTHQPDPEPERSAAEAVASETHAEAGRARPTGRVLPDLLEQSRAEMRLRHELEERTARLRAQQSASRPSPGSRPKRAKVPASAETHAGRKAVLDPIPAADTVSLGQPVLAAMRAGALASVETVAASSLNPPHDQGQRNGAPRGNSRRGENQDVGHRSERQNASMLLRAGERWKRRLPRVCW